MEFERRIQLISPDLIIDEKPNSDLIFSILNEAQDRYVMMNYVGDDQMETETNIHTRNTDSIKSLLVEKEFCLQLPNPSGNALKFGVTTTPPSTTTTTVRDYR